MVRIFWKNQILEGIDLRWGGQSLKEIGGASFFLHKEWRVSGTCLPGVVVKADTLNDFWIGTWICREWRDMDYVHVDGLGIKFCTDMVVWWVFYGLIYWSQMDSSQAYLSRKAWWFGTKSTVLHFQHLCKGQVLRTSTWSNLSKEEGSETLVSSMPVGEAMGKNAPTWPVDQLERVFKKYINNS